MNKRVYLDERHIPGKPLGRHINHDPRSKAYPVSGDSSQTTVVWERQVPVFDQGQVGSCTGNAGEGSLGTGPNYAAAQNAVTVGNSIYTFDEKGALALYSAATKIDSAKGTYPPTDTGSDGLSVATVLKTAGLISGYTHAFGLSDAFAAIKSGSLIIGSYWMSGMDSPTKEGIVKATGYVRGGHEYESVGYHADRDLWEFVNSWGTSYGVAGHFFYSSDDFDTLLKQQGDVILFTPADAPAPVPNPTPSPTPVADDRPTAAAFDAAAKTLDPWAAKNTRTHAAQAWQSLRK